MKIVFENYLKFCSSCRTIGHGDSDCWRKESRQDKITENTSRNTVVSLRKDKEQDAGVKVGKPQYLQREKISNISNLEVRREEQLSRLAEQIMETTANEIIGKAYEDVFENNKEEELYEEEEHEGIHDNFNGCIGGNNVKAGVLC